MPTEGNVPKDDWEHVLLDSVTKRGSGHTPDKKHPEYWDGSIKWISLQDSAQLDALYIEDTAATITIEGIKNSSAVLHQKGTVVLSRDAGVGKSAIMATDMAVSQHFMAWTCGQRLDNHFLYYWLQSKKPEFERIANGNTIKTIGLPYFKELTIPLPPLEEQKHIASALSGIDTLISSLDQLIAKKRDIQQTTMQQLLTGHRRLPGFSGKWKHGVFRDVVRSLEAGVSVNSSDDLPEPGLPCVLKTSALSGGNFFPNEAKTIVAADRGRACTNPKRNTILISRMNTPALVGEIAYVGKDYDWLFLPDRLWMTRFMSDDCVNARWLAYLLSSRPYRRLLQDSATGTSGSMKNISKGVLLNLQISYPAIEEQTAIATILSDMDTELDALEARRDKARQLKQGMMQELLTGRIRLV